ncbi:SseB family protein [Solwaraspora sp. WMMA2056]|uniref:SseB family protein n=1 Tax=Solwaraspora sp. WMMA2056 TaxID=3015161 RepID=UPI00259AEE12|nr:SseB family protein [Solwaraspora sp. WMMA2056]WJK41456.1 SseB family protein [Solwaraspora sp. WMMA2056]
MTGPLLLPVSDDTAAGRAPFAWPTVDHDGTPHVLAFTSPQAIADALPGQSVQYVTVEFAEVAANLPDGWCLAVDPGSPTAVLLPASELRDQLSTVGGGTAGDVARALRDAVAAEDPDALMAALLQAEFTVPLAPPATGVVPGLTDPDFPWWCVPDADGNPSVPVFTSPALLRQALDDPPATVAASSVQLFAHWPDPGWHLAVDPGTPFAVSLPGTAVREVSGWLDEVRRTVTGAAAGPIESGSDPPDQDPDLDPDLPVRMQVVVPHRYLQAYVSDNYDRVAGVVHRWHGPGRDTPRRLYARLALLGPESPFTVDDEWVPVLRWTPGPDTPPSWLDGGPQHRSLVVPDGAQLRVLHHDGGDELLASYDRAARRWLPTDQPAD